MSVVNISYGTYTALAATWLPSLPSSQTLSWKSGLIDNQSSTKALDYEIFVKLTTTNTAPANDKAVYIWLCPAITTDGGTTWLYSDGGTTQLPTDGDARYIIAYPNNLKLLGVLSYTTQNMTMQGSFNVSNVVGQSIPDGFLIIITNFSGAALWPSGCIVAYRAITQTIT